MVPNVSQEIMLQLKNLKPGNCIAFGSAFKVPTVMYIEMPDPQPLSNNVDLENVWYGNNQPTTQNQFVNLNTNSNSVQDIMSRQINQAREQVNTITPVNPVVETLPVAEVN